MCFLQFKELEDLGYKAISYAFFDDDIQTAYTKHCRCCLERNVIDYIRAVIIAGIELKQIIGCQSCVHTCTHSQYALY